MIEINWRPSPRELRLFGIAVLPCVLLALAGLAWWRWHALGAVIACVGVAAGIALVGLAGPRLLRPLYLAWMCAAWPIGWLVANLLLAAIWALVVTPLGLIGRLVGRDRLARKFDRSAASYWTPRQAPRDKTHYLRQY